MNATYVEQMKVVSERVFAGIEITGREITPEAVAITGTWNGKKVKVEHNNEQYMDRVEFRFYREAPESMKERGFEWDLYDTRELTSQPDEYLHKELEEMTREELSELRDSHMVAWLQSDCSCQMFRQHWLDVDAEMQKRDNPPVEIHVFWESGYKWSVDISNEEESRITNVNKAEAVALAKHIKQTEYPNAQLNIETLTRSQKSQNMKDLHVNETFYTLDRRNKY